MSSPRVGVIDSGVHAAHPHINRVVEGVTIFPDGHDEPGCLDRLGHGTAVAAAILEKAPDAELFAIKVFHDRLATGIDTLVRAIDWAIDHDMELINLSLGTANSDHEKVLQHVVSRVITKGIALIAAYEDGGVRWLPGSLPGVIPVALNWDCPREEYRTTALPDGRTLYHASGYPRPIPNVPPEHNLKGISFAVANVTGLLARDAGTTK